MATFCLIHGKWHDGTSWGRVPELLRADGHAVLTPQLPYEDPRTTHAERIQSAVAALDPAAGARGNAAARADDVDQRGARADPDLGEAREPVVVVGHSLAAAYAPLVADARPGARLVHLCPANVGPFAHPGAPVRATRAGLVFPRNREDGTSVWEPDRAVAVMYPRLARANALELAARLKPGASPTDAYPLHDPPAAPTTFVYGAHDEFFEPDWSRWAAHELAHVEPIELDTGHFPMFEAPEAVARILRAAAG